MPELPDLPSASQPTGPRRHFRDDEVEELLTVMRQPDWKGNVSEAADVACIDRRRAKLLLKREIAMVATSPEINGNITHTARALGLPMKTVWNIMNSDGFLKTVNGTTDPATQVPSLPETIDREALTEQELSEMKALLKQDAALSSFKWEKLGLNAKQQQHLLDLESFAKGSLHSSLNLTHGGLIYCFAELIGLFKDTKKRLDDNQLPIEMTEFGEKDQQKEYLYLLTSITAEIRNINQQVQRSQILRIKQAEIELQQRMVNGTNGGKGKRKGLPGFTSGPPPAVLVQVNASKGTDVKVTDGTAQ